jgi:protein-L-isoaspartate O-methyltransferase
MTMTMTMTTRTTTTTRTRSGVLLPKLVRLAVPRLGIEPHHRLLEIGCGGGTAVAAVAEQLTTGHILAIDRSRAQVVRATERNAGPIARGVAEIKQVDLSQLVVDDQQFDTIFALNVNLFLADDPSTVETIRTALRRRGRLVLGYWRRDPRQLAGRAERSSQVLQARGLTTPTLDWATPEHLYLTTLRR